jgi:hypothetical protein
VVTTTVASYLFGGSYKGLTAGVVGHAIRGSLATLTVWISLPQ